MKVRPVGAELLNADRLKDGQNERLKDGQTDMTKLIVAFRNFANARKNYYTKKFRKLHKPALF